MTPTSRSARSTSPSSVSCQLSLVVVVLRCPKGSGSRRPDDQKILPPPNSSTVSVLLYCRQQNKNGGEECSLLAATCGAG